MIVLPAFCVGIGLRCAQLLAATVYGPSSHQRGIALHSVPSAEEFLELVSSTKPSFVIVPEISTYSHLAAAAWATDVPVVSCPELQAAQNDCWALLDADGETLSIAENASDVSALQRRFEEFVASNKVGFAPSEGSALVLCEAHNESHVLGAAASGASGFGVIKPESLFTDAYWNSGGTTGFSALVRSADFFHPPRVRFFDREEYARTSASGGMSGFGRRGVRLIETEPSLVRVFRRAIELLAAPDVVTVLPMVSSAAEVRNAADALGAGPSRMGVTIETPAAVLEVEEIVREVQFVEIGVNDLTQFTMAWDRNIPNDQLLPRSMIAAPVLRQIADVASACRRGGVFCTVGMDLRPSQRIAGQLIESGVFSVSCAPSLVSAWLEAFSKARLAAA